MPPLESSRIPRIREAIEGEGTEQYPLSNSHSPMCVGSHELKLAAPLFLSPIPCSLYPVPCTLICYEGLYMALGIEKAR